MRGRTARSSSSPSATTRGMSATSFAARPTPAQATMQRRLSAASASRTTRRRSSAAAGTVASWSVSCFSRASFCVDVCTAMGPEHRQAVARVQRPGSGLFRWRSARSPDLEPVPSTCRTRSTCFYRSFHPSAQRLARRHPTAVRRGGQGGGSGDGRRGSGRRGLACRLRPALRPRLARLVAPSGRCRLDEVSGPSAAARLQRGRAAEAEQRRPAVVDHQRAGRHLGSTGLDQVCSSTAASSIWDTAVGHAGASASSRARLAFQTIMHRLRGRATASRSTSGGETRRSTSTTCGRGRPRS